MSVVSTNIRITVTEDVYRIFVLLWNSYKDFANDFLQWRTIWYRTWSVDASDKSLRNTQHLRLTLIGKLNQQLLSSKISGSIGEDEASAAVPRIAVCDSSSVLSVNCKFDNVTSYV